MEKSWNFVGPEKWEPCLCLITLFTKRRVLGVLVVYRCWRRRSSRHRPRRRPRPPCSCRATRSSTASKLVACRGVRTSCKSWDARKTITLRLAFLPLRLPSSTSLSGADPRLAFHPLPPEANQRLAFHPLPPEADPRLAFHPLPPGVDPGLPVRLQVPTPYYFPISVVSICHHVNSWEGGGGGVHMWPLPWCLGPQHAVTPPCTGPCPPDMFQLVYYEAQTVGLRTVDIPLEYLCFPNFWKISIELKKKKLVPVTHRLGSANVYCCYCCCWYRG